MDDDCEKIDIIKRQTNYDEDTIKKKLTDFEGNIEKVILDYMGSDKKDKSPEKRITKNQARYKEIRGMMDDAMRSYEKKKEKENET